MSGARASTNWTARLLGVGALVSLALGGAALADAVVLHEYVPNLGADEGSSLVSNRSAEPAAIVYAGELLHAPSDGPPTSSERVIEASPASSESSPDDASSLASFAPDRVTALHGAVPYFEVFTPAIAPYKRVSALDAVSLGPGSVPILVVGHPHRERVAIEGPGTAPPDGRMRDRFWGSVVLDFTSGREVPFPSVSPESRLLSLRTNPEVPLHLERDGSGNFFAVLEPRASATQTRVVFLTDAPRSYFGFQANQRFPAVRADALGGEVAPLPPSVLRDANLFARELGLSRESRFGEALGTLVRHFRSFVESDTPPSDTGNVYLDLARGMLGVCRHRAYAFVITASALGISSRFVSNEAHAWVEVHLPEHGGWLRIDLGGSAGGLDPRNVEQGPSYDAHLADPFPRPPEYQEALARAAASNPSSGGGASGGGASGGGAGGGGASGGGASPRSSGATGASGPPAGATSADEASVERDDGSPSRPEHLTDDPSGSGPRSAVRLAVAHASAEVFRGQTLEVSGSATSEGHPAAGLRVEIVLVEEARERLLGASVTSEGGVFHGVFGVPPDVATGPHHLVVRTPGDARYLAAVAD